MRHVGEDGVLHGGVQRVRVRFLVCARGHAEEAILRVDGIQAAVVANVHPGDIVTHRPHFIALLGIHLGRNQHGQIRLAAGRGERGSDILHIALRVFNAQNKHVLGHPAFLHALVRGNAQRKALFAQQHVAAVTRVDGPNGVFLRELHNVAVLGVNVGLGVLAAHEIVRFIAQLLQRFHTHTRHDVHVQHNVDGIRHFNAHLGERRANGAHAVRNDIHGAALHHAGIHGDELGFHLAGLHPIVDGGGVFLVFGADERAVLHAGHVVLCGVVQHAARQQLFVQRLHLARAERLFAQSLQLFFRAVNPHNFIRGHEVFHFLDPGEDVFVVRQCHIPVTFLTCISLPALPAGARVRDLNSLYLFVKKSTSEM